PLRLTLFPYTTLFRSTPLVWISDCFGMLGFLVHAKRYLMLTLCEDALREKGTISPNTTGAYFRLVWRQGLQHAELQRYAGQFLTDRKSTRLNSSHVSI